MLFQRKVNLICKAKHISESVKNCRLKSFYTGHFSIFFTIKLYYTIIKR